MRSWKFSGRLLAWLSPLILAVPVQALAQSTVGELLEKGGKQLSKDDVTALMPARFEMVWPNRQGEEELVLSADGKISGKGYHYSSRSESPATGQWRLEDDGRLCAPKTFTAWNSSTNQCWYVYSLNNEYYGALKKDADTRVGKVKAFARLDQ